MLKRQSVTKALSLFIVGVFTVIAGLFVWQQPLFFAKNSSASSKQIQNIILVDAQQSSILQQMLTTQIHQRYAQSTVITTAAIRQNPLMTEALRQHIVDTLAPRPTIIQGKVAFIIILQPEAFNPEQNGMGDASQARIKLQQNIELFMDFLQNRPGVFPQGFSVYFATTVTGGSQDSSHKSCLGSLDYSQVTSMYAALESKYPGIFHSIVLKTLNESDFAYCSLNSSGNTKLATLLTDALSTFEK